MAEQEATQNNEEVAQGNENDNATEAVSVADIEKKEEEKLKAKFPMIGRPMSGQSVFLQKRLANRLKLTPSEKKVEFDELQSPGRQKYFDSGDYQMAKQKSAAKARQVPAGIAYVTGEAIPTPETVPVRKTSIIQPCKFTSSSTT